jgi:hypothetical protein
VNWIACAASIYEDAAPEEGGRGSSTRRSCRGKTLFMLCERNILVLLDGWSSFPGQMGMKPSWTFFCHSYFFFEWNVVRRQLTQNNNLLLLRTLT